MDLPRQINTGDPYPLRGLVGFGLNYRMWPDSNGLLAAIDKLDFIVRRRPLRHRQRQVCRHRPARLQLGRAERAALLSAEVRHLTQPVIEPLGESRSDTDIIFALAEKSGLRLPDATTPSTTAQVGGYLAQRRPRLQQRRSKRHGLDPRAQRHDHGRAQGAPGRHARARPLAARASRSTRRTASPLPAARWSSPRRCWRSTRTARASTALPLYREPRLSPVSTPEVAKDYPLVLSTGSRLPMFIHSRTFRLPGPAACGPTPPPTSTRPTPPAGHRPGRRDRALHAERAPSR